MIQQQTAVDVKRKQGHSRQVLISYRQEGSVAHAVAISGRGKSLCRGVGVVLASELREASAIVWIRGQPMGLPGPQLVETFLGDEAHA